MSVFTPRLTTAHRQGTVEEKTIINVTAGVPLKVLVVYTNVFNDDGAERDLSQPALMRGVVSLGFIPIT